MKRLFLFICLLLGTVICSLAQAPDATQQQGDGTVVQEVEPDTEKSDHALVDPREVSGAKTYRSEPVKLQPFNRSQWRKVVGEEHYDEDAEEVKKSTSTPSFNLPWAAAALRIGAYVVIIIVILLLIYFVSKNIILTSKLQKKEVSSLVFTEGDEDIEQLNLEALLEIALRDGNFRMAVRVYYLQLLKQFNEKGLIAWKKHKTNRDYLQELYGRGYGDEFRRFTLLYERIWYGPYAITDISFQQFVLDYQAVSQRLNLLAHAEE